MTSLAVSVVAVLLTCGYLAIGYRCAIRNLPRSIRRAGKEWGWDDIGTPYARGDVRIGFITMLLFWVVRIPMNAVSNNLDSVIDQHNPEAMEKRVAEQDQRIAELERELGMR